MATMAMPTTRHLVAQEPLADVAELGLLADAQGAGLDLGAAERAGVDGLDLALDDHRRRSTAAGASSRRPVRDLVAHGLTSCS